MKILIIKIRMSWYIFQSQIDNKIRGFAFWLLGWKNLQSLYVVYKPDDYTKIAWVLKNDGLIHKIISTGNTR
jgi:hypothetical protein